MHCTIMICVSYTDFMCFVWYCVVFYITIYMLQQTHTIFALLLLLYALFNHPRLLIQVARVQKAQFSYRLDGLISSQVTGHWGELCNRTGEVHPVDPFHSLDILKNHFASVAFCRNSGVYNVQNGAVIELSFVVSVKGFPRH